MKTEQRAAHTPGPWAVDRSDFHEVSGLWIRAAVYEGKERWCAVAEVNVRPSDEKKLRAIREADARLIAAAPELLAALETAAEIVKTARQYFPKSIKNRDRFALELGNAQIVAAIVKAKEAR